jgi:hypothetical protein
LDYAAVLPIAIEGSLVLPSCPDDSGESIGERDGGLVVTALALAVERPAAQPIEGVPGALGAMSCEQCRSCTVHEQCSQVSVALLGDFSQATFFGTRAFVGSEAEPGGEVTARGEALDIADHGTQCGAGQCADAGDLAQLLDAYIGASQGVELVFDVKDFLLEQTDFLQHLGECCAQGLRNLTLGVGERRTDPILGDIHAKRDREAEFAQDAAQRIHIPLSRAHPLAAQTVQGLDLLSLNGLNGHRANLGTARRLNEGGGIGLVSLVAPDIGFHVLGRQEAHGVTQLGNTSRPVVRAAAGFHHDLTGRKSHEEAKELGAGQPLPLCYTPVLTGHREKIFFAKSTATIVAFISDSFW